MINALYRGKRADNGEWVYGYYVKDVRSYGLVSNPSYREEHQIWYNKDNKQVCAEVIPETVGQWTGKVDTNGVKIFDGDYVGDYCEDDNGNDVLGAYGIVTWWESDARYMLTTEEGFANDWTYEDEALAENWRHLFVLGDKFGMKYPVD